MYILRSIKYQDAVFFVCFLATSFMYCSRARQTDTLYGDAGFLVFVLNAVVHVCCRDRQIDRQTAILDRL